MEKILTIIIGVFLFAGSVSAGLWSYYNDQGLNMPNLQDRAEIAAEYGIPFYRGTAEENERLLKSLQEKDLKYWVKRLLEREYKPLTIEEQKLVPDEAWYEITPQLVRVVNTKDNFLGGSERAVVNEFICRGSSCDKYIDNSLLGSSPITRYKTTLKSSMNSTQSTISVSSASTFDGTAITMGLIGNEVYLSIEPGTSREEISRCTAISGTTWSSCTRGLAFSGQSISSVTANRKAHNAGATVVMSNVHYWYNSDTNTTSTLAIGDGSTSPARVGIWANNGLTPTRTLFYDNSTQKWVATDDGSTTYNLVDGGSGLSAGKNIDITASVVGVNTTVYIPTIYASSTDPGLFTTSTAPNANNTFNVGIPNLAWKDVFASGTVYGDIISAQTSLLVGGKSISPSFGGNGDDGALSVSANTTTTLTQDLNVFNYSSITIDAGATLAFTNTTSTGAIVILRSQGDCDIAGNISVMGLGANDATQAEFLINTTSTIAHRGDTGGAGSSGTGGDGGAGGTILLSRMSYLAQGMRSILVAPTSGSGDGSVGVNGGAGPGGSGGESGDPAGGLLIECGGALNFTGNIFANGTDGADGGAGTDGGSNRGSGGGGGGAGGSGGMVGIFYGSLTSQSGSINVSGGVCGIGGNGGAGLSGGGTAGGGGGGGGSAGTWTSAGLAGGAGGTGSSNGNASDCAGGVSTDADDGSGGGGGANGATGYSVIQKNTTF